MSSDQKKIIDDVAHTLTILRLAFGPIVDEALDRAIDFVEKHNSPSNPLAFGVMGTFAVVVPEGATDAQSESLLVINLVTNNTIIDVYGYFGETISTADALSKAKKKAAEAGVSLSGDSSQLIKVGENIGQKTETPPAHEQEDPAKVIPLYKGPYDGSKVDKSKLH